MATEAAVASWRAMAVRAPVEPEATAVVSELARLATAAWLTGEGCSGAVTLTVACEQIEAPVVVPAGEEWRARLVAHPSLSLHPSHQTPPAVSSCSGQRLTHSANEQRLIASGQRTGGEGE